MILYINKYRIRPGTQEEMAADIKSSGCEAAMEKQPGNLFFRLSFSAAEPDTLYLTDGWEDQASCDAHLICDAMPLWRAVKDKYVVDKDVRGFLAQQKTDAPQ